MTRRRRLRRRLFWAGVLLGLLFLLTALSALRVGIWAGHQVAALTPRSRKGKTMLRRTSLVTVAALGALLFAVPASADRWGADQADQDAVARMLDAREQALGVKAVIQEQAIFDAQGRAYAQIRDRQLATEPGPDYHADGFAQAIQSATKPEPVRDDRFRLDPTRIVDPVTASTAGRDIEWPQIGIGFSLAIALGLGLILAVRLTTNRPLTR